MKYDVVVIGSGMSGLMAAAKALARNKRTLIIAKGQGTLPLTSGCIDIWGYQLDNPLNPTQNPYKEIELLALRQPDHPYAKVLDVLAESVDYLKEILISTGYKITGNIQQNQSILTALGTERITALAPSSMIISKPEKIIKIIAVGFKNYPDFFPQMFLDNLKTTRFSKVETIPITIDLGVKEVLRSNHLSLLLEQENCFSKVVAEIQESINNYDQTLVVLPAILGRNIDSKIHERLVRVLCTQVIEVPGLPPSMPGQRLDKALTSYVRKKGGEFRYNCEVIDYQEKDGKIISVSLLDSSNLKTNIEAENIILAAGSFLGGGLVAKRGPRLESIFNLPVVIPNRVEGDNSLLSLEGQAFLDGGLEVDDQLRPLKEINNLYAVGSILAYSNYAAEKSGLGVALATGYKAGMLV